jgi:hypothetical protein
VSTLDLSLVVKTLTDTIFCSLFSGSSFLKRWMDFLEEKADLRYPDAADLQHV